MAEHIIVCIFIFSISILASASSLPFEDCGSAQRLESISISGCPKYPCHLKIGSTANVTTELLIRGKNLNYADLDQKVYFIVSRIRLETRATPDPCEAVQRAENDRSTCNTKIGERIASKTTIAVQNLPPLPATLFWLMKNRKTGEQVVCYKVPVQLVN